MRYAVLVIRSDGGGLHPIDTGLTAARTVYRERIHQIKLLEDGTAVVLYGLAGDLEKARDLLDGEPTVLDTDVVGERTGVAYVHFEPNGNVRSLLTVVREHEFVLQFPVQPLEAGGVRVVLVGEDDLFQEAVDELPGDLVVSLRKIGDYNPDYANVLSVLTDKQLEIIRTAFERGYYTKPRGTTHESIAHEVGLSAPTVSEHLRTAENKVLNALFGSIAGFETESAAGLPSE